MASRAAALARVGGSIPTAVFALMFAEAAACAPVSAEQAMRAAQAMTSIGRDPCRAGRDDPETEIVVCGRRTNPYEVPLYTIDPNADGRDAAGTAAGLLKAAGQTAAGCHARGEACLEPLVVYRSTFGKGTKSKPQIGKD